ncbi:MAG TPA: bifunctional nuclease family protein [Candidatus Limnocylindrales bacterium]|nr:bifunctional nuclease family protein [Candidatus Limnocylindrales bacterium]
MARLVEMVVESVRVHMLSSRHVVILKDNVGDRYLPIWIGAWEASAIAMRLQGLQAERPLTHDLFTAALEQLGVRVARVVVSDLSDETYHAQLVLERDGVEEEVDARPSDALAIAVRTESPIYCADSVLAQAALSADPDEEGAEDEPAEGGELTEGESARDEGDRPRRRRAPLESVGNAPADPRLDMFRDFVNSLEVDPNAGGGGGDTGGRRG